MAENRTGHHPAESAGHLKWQPGDPAPWFIARSTSAERYVFNSVAGRYVVLCFFGSAAHPVAQAALQTAAANRQLFDDTNFVFFGISIDPEDERQRRVAPALPGMRYFWDFDHSVSRLYGAVAAGSAEGPPPSGALFRPYWLVLDPQLRVLGAFPLSAGATVMRFVAGLPPPALHAGGEVPAPVLVLPRVFEPDFCRQLIALYDARGGTPSGFMREIGGKTVAVTDPTFKRRADYEIQEEPVRAAARARLTRRLLPEIEKAFQFRATRMERYTIACYDAAESGHFNSHRDNTTKGTAHRRFAVTINLNADDCQGGDLRFPEFGSRTYRAPTGGAVVFSCSLLHEARPVTTGRRYAFLPFLYDEAGAAVREANRGFLATADQPATSSLD